MQRIDFLEVFAPTIRRKSLQISLVLYLMLNLFIHQVGIVGAYFESLLIDNKFSISIKLLLEMHNLYQIQKSLLYRLLKSLYNLKQSGRLWNQNVIAFYKRINFRLLNGNLTILIHCLRGKINVDNLYVNNFLLASNTMRTFNVLKPFLVEEYDIKDLGKVKVIIEWQIN